MNNEAFHDQAKPVNPSQNQPSTHALHHPPVSASYQWAAEPAKSVCLCSLLPLPKEFCSRLSGMWGRYQQVNSIPVMLLHCTPHHLLLLALLVQLHLLKLRLDVCGPLQLRSQLPLAFHQRQHLRPCLSVVAVPPVQRNGAEVRDDSLTVSVNLRHSPVNIVFMLKWM